MNPDLPNSNPQQNQRQLHMGLSLLPIMVIPTHLLALICVRLHSRFSRILLCNLHVLGHEPGLEDREVGQTGADWGSPRPRGVRSVSRGLEGRTSELFNHTALGAVREAPWDHSAAHSSLSVERGDSHLKPALTQHQQLGETPSLSRPTWPLLGKTEACQGELVCH